MNIGIRTSRRLREQPLTRREIGSADFREALPPPSFARESLYKSKEEIFSGMLCCTEKWCHFACSHAIFTVQKKWSSKCVVHCPVVGSQNL